MTRVETEKEERLSKRSGRRSIPPAAKAILAAGLLWAVFAVVPFSDVLGAIAGADPGLLLAGVATPALGLWISAGRLKLLTDAQAMRFSMSELVKINLAARFYGMALPGTLAGGVVRWHRLSRRSAKGAALAAIAYARLFHIFSLVGLGLVFLAFALPPIQGARVGVLLVVVLAGLIGGGYLVFHAEESRLWSMAARWGPDYVARWGRRWFTVARPFRQLSRRYLGALLGLSILEHLVGVLSVWLLARSVAVEASFLVLGWVRSAVGLLTMLPITLSGLGVREGGLILTLEPYGVPGARAVALSFLILAGSVLLGLAGGALEARDAFADRSS